ncbi:MAG: DUF4105 domain-containing protein [Cytophagales bacterium]|nr:DUF4105 domain-containing protein [Cytophagales bacterium]
MLGRFSTGAFWIFFFSCLLVRFELGGKALPSLVSESTQLSLLTLSPSKERVYYGFGHSAIRIQDPIQNLDLIFSYGTFDFNQPNFYLNYIIGHLWYRLSVVSFPEFFRRLRRSSQITVTEQELNLSPTDIGTIYAILSEEVKPENCSYLYRYMDKNCSTRIRDLFEQVLGSRFDWNISHFRDEGATFRSMMNKNLPEFPWEHLGINLVLGSPTLDTLIAPKSYLFLPEYMKRAFQYASLEDKKIVKRAKIIYHIDRMGGAKYDLGNILAHPIFCLWMLFLSLVLLSHIGRSKSYLALGLDILVFSFTGLIGCFLIFLWGFTDHISGWNFHLLWSCPLYVFVIFFPRLHARWIAMGISILILCSILLFCIMSLSGSGIPLASFLPLPLMFFLRLFYRFFYPSLPQRGFILKSRG